MVYHSVVQQRDIVVVGRLSITFITDLLLSQFWKNFEIFAQHLAKL